MFSEIFKKYLLVIWYFFKPYKWQTVGVIGLMFFSGLMEAFNLAALYPIMNYGLNVNSNSRVMKVFEQLLQVFGSENKFVAACLLLIILTVLSTVIKIFYNYSMNRLISFCVGLNQKLIFEKLTQHPYAYFLEKQQGSLIYAGTIAPIGVAQTVLCALRLSNNLVISIFFCGLLLLLSWQGMLTVIVVGFMYILFIKRITTCIVNRAANLSVQEDTKKNIILNEFFSGIKTIKAYFGIPVWKKKYADVVENSVRYNFDVAMGRSYPETFMKFTFFILIGIAGVVFGMGDRQNLLPLIPILGTFVAVASRLLPYLNLVGNDIVNINRFMPDTRIVYDLLHEEVVSFREGTKKFKNFNDAITFQGVHFKYPQSEGFLLKGVSFSIPKNKMTAIVGASGSGKTSIVNLLIRLYEPQQGRIFVDQTPIDELELSSYLGKIGYISQESFIFNGTIRENICFGADYSDEEIIQAASLANAHEFISDSQNGYNTVVGDSGMKLSGGQRQRLAIARAMLRKPFILILDEATSSLDNISEKNVQEAIQKISHYTTVLVIAHRLTTVQDADKIIVLDAGQILEEGTHAELYRKEKAYFGLYKNS